MLSLPTEGPFEEHLMNVEFRNADLIWVETPRNADMDVVNLIRLRETLDGRFPEKNVMICLDATFVPPPLQKCLSLKTKKNGAYAIDLVMYSGTKFFGGHSDALLGVLVMLSSC